MSVKVDEKVTADLKMNEEAVLEVIALNPDITSEEIRQRYDLSQRTIVEAVDSLQEKGLVRPLDSDEENDLVWEVPLLGRITLLKCAQMMRFRIMEAKVREQPKSVISQLEKKKEYFETAYKQTKALFE